MVSQTLGFLFFSYCFNNTNIKPITNIAVTTVTVLFRPSIVVENLFVCFVFLGILETPKVPQEAAVPTPLMELNVFFSTWKQKISINK